MSWQLVALGALLAVAVVIGDLSAVVMMIGLILIWYGTRGLSS